MLGRHRRYHYALLPHFVMGRRSNSAPSQSHNTILLSICLLEMSDLKQKTRLLLLESGSCPERTKSYDSLDLPVSVPDTTELPRSLVPEVELVMVEERRCFMSRPEGCQCLHYPHYDRSPSKCQGVSGLFWKKVGLEQSQAKEHESSDRKPHAIAIVPQFSR